MSEKCHPDDPRRCQHTTPHGQCEYLAVEDAKYCNYHSSGQSQRKLDLASKQRYQLDNIQLREAYTRLHDDQAYLELKDEISIVSMLLEKRINTIKTDSDLMMSVGPVNQLVQRLESMKISLMKIQQQLGLVLGKDQVRHLAVKMADILDDELGGIEDKDDRMERILKRICEAIEVAGREKSEQE